MLGMSALGLGGLLGASMLSQSTANASEGFSKAKRCIFIFLWGGPSHIDTLDPKPNAPDTVRGQFKPIATATPGTQISELLPKIAKLSEMYTVIRSLYHDDPAHLSSAHATLTGQFAPVIRSDAEPPSDRDTPHLGSVLSHLRPAPAGLPSFVTMPWLAYHPAAPGGKAPGQHAGWLGHQYDPLLVGGDPSAADWKVPVLELREQVSVDRLSRGMELLQDIDRSRKELDTSSAGQTLNGFQSRAMKLLASKSVRDAFDLSQESDAMRDAYGRNIHGQCVLLARRLIERDVPIVSVNWHDDKSNFWDTHGNNFNKLKDSLCPPSDQALATLLTDLQDRGLLDETLVAWVGEFGRSPTINKSAGREHHPFCYSGLLAGAGIKGGHVHGASDSRGHSPEHSPVTQQDFAATMLHALGVSPELMLADEQGRPHRVYGGRPLESLFA